MQWMKVFFLAISQTLYSLCKYCIAHYTDTVTEPWLLASLGKSIYCNNEVKYTNTKFAHITSLVPHPKTPHSHYEGHVHHWSSPTH